MELYYIIAITDHDRGEAMGSLYHAAGLHLILSMPARGTATVSYTHLTLPTILLV